MTILKTITDNIGDMLGTSKLAKLNNRVFRSILGTDIKRAEYDMCDGASGMLVPSRKAAAVIRNQNPDERQRMADHILNGMVANGTVFTDNRIAVLASGQQTRPGVTNLSYKVRNQMSSSGSLNLNRALRHQDRLAQIPQLLPR